MNISLLSRLSILHSTKYDTKALLYSAVFHISMCFFFCCILAHVCLSVGAAFIGFQNVPLQHKMVSRNRSQYAIFHCAQYKPMFVYHFCIALWLQLWFPSTFVLVLCLFDLIQVIRCNVLFLHPWFVLSLFFRSKEIRKMATFSTHQKMELASKNARCKHIYKICLCNIVKVLAFFSDFNIFGVSMVFFFLSVVRSWECGIQYAAYFAYSIWIGELGNLGLVCLI